MESRYADFSRLRIVNARESSSQQYMEQDKDVELEFYKLSGAGNDFIVIDNIDRKIPEEGRRELFSQWCRRGMSIGADGVLLVEPSDKDSDAHFRMRYYNADGGEAETCGNGSRCIARFAFAQGIASRQMVFQTLAGNYRAEVLENNEVKVEMSDAFDLRENISIADDTFRSSVDFINTGVPHVVVLEKDLAGAAVVPTGRHLRHHAEFAPAGTNVNFAHVIDEDHLEVRTYERGVEDETLACGTGCIASSIQAVRKGLARTPVQVRTASGETLTINFTLTENGATNVTLQGSAHIVYRGFMAVHHVHHKDGEQSKEAQAIETLRL